MVNESENLLTINEACAYLRIGRAAIYLLIKAGKLTPVRVEYRYRFLPQDLRDYLERGKVQKETTS